MPQIQIAQPPAEIESEPEVVGTAEPRQLSLEEMLRIMDVATALRKEHDVVEEQLNLDQIKVRLRERLLEAAQVMGERLTAEQIDTAIENYYDKLHTFEEPKWSFSVLMAHIYVRRVTIIKWAIGIGAVVALLWSLLIVVVLPSRELSGTVLAAGCHELPMATAIPLSDSEAHDSDNKSAETYQEPSAS
ncbi:DUF6384 family protein [Bythopirellula polymerisocia]|uniref:Uncharacterized protein n=1 Tax=Bythopirellula polymerisocia TaxID=2528003 RepID=A0A5C6CJW5_9BACT|nr:DUF6384 family protein [Bythopirellula polymerisocia]TWU23581.1 hypothetical protein Pla144_37560 [Bythopirellula polymerisocia]